MDENLIVQSNVEQRKNGYPNVPSQRRVDVRHSRRSVDPSTEEQAEQPCQIITIPLIMP